MSEKLEDELRQAFQEMNPYHTQIGDFVSAVLPVVAHAQAAARAEQRESDAVITDGPHPANSGLDSFTLAHIGFTIRAADSETGESA